jgi:hypothetical protein
MIRRFEIYEYTGQVISVRTVFLNLSSAAVSPPQNYLMHFEYIEYKVTKTYREGIASALFSAPLLK